MTDKHAAVVLLNTLPVLPLELTNYWLIEQTRPIGQDRGRVFLLLSPSLLSATNSIA